ncbi:MAG: hypothetical protein HN961_02350, partial [Planctomycetes bacterium]|nr:hypothetical protein [Planctomycetota bacterium]
AKGLSRWINTQLATEAINIQRQTDLQTQDVELFQNSLKDLIKKLYEELPSYSGSGHKVIFNLTGGFKPVQGFLQSIAHFFADECVYIFESSSVLLTMPRLPVELATPNSIKKHINFFRNIDLQPKNPIPSDIPDTLLLVSGRECTLSAWGDLIWNEAKKALYNERILDSPNENKIRYGKQFRRDINGIEQDRIFILNNRLDQLNRYLYDKKNLCSLDFKKLRGNPTPPSTHEFDAWADGAAYRVFGHFETDTFVLDKLAKGLH